MSNRRKINGHAHHEPSLEEVREEVMRNILARQTIIRLGRPGVVWTASVESPMSTVEVEDRHFIGTWPDAWTCTGQDAVGLATVPQDPTRIVTYHAVGWEAEDHRVRIVVPKGWVSSEQVIHACELVDGIAPFGKGLAPFELWVAGDDASSGDPLRGIEVGRLQ